MSFQPIDLTSKDFHPRKLSPEDRLQAAFFTEYQIALIQECMTDAAQQLINLDYDPEHPTSFLQTQAALRGRLDGYKLLLTLCEQSYESVNPSAFSG